jgi:hypothetical protein
MNDYKEYDLESVTVHKEETSQEELRQLNEALKKEGIK